MRKLKLMALAAGAFLLTSCGAKQEVVDKMADEMCSAMAKYHEDDPMTMLDAANAMLEIAGKETEYKDVSEAQMKEAMENKCPDGYKKFLKMSEESSK